MRIMTELSDGCNAQSVGALAKRFIVDLINDAPDQLSREDRIQMAVEEGALTYAEAYALRTDGDL